VRCDPIANRALEALMQDYTVAEEESCLVLTKKTGDMKLFLNELDDLHQWEFVHNRAMAQEIDRLRLLLTTVNQHRESWKIRALRGGAPSLDATANTGGNRGLKNVTAVGYVSPNRFLEKHSPPVFAPGEGLEKIVPNEILKKIGNEIGRLDQGGSASR